MKDYHESHCISCYSSNCSSLQCPVIPCPSGCTASFHECKAEDHSKICAHSRKPCINAAYGCPFILKNMDIAQHLQFCPASVVICTMEWGRIPLGHAQPVAFTSEKNVFQSKSDVTYKHLDQELALRDQRVMFENAYSESVFKTLVADLTAEEQAECYKAVTDDSGSGCSSVSSSLSSSPTDSEDNGSKIVFRPFLPPMKPTGLQNAFGGLGRLQNVTSLGLYRYVSTTSVGTSTEDLDVCENNNKFLYPQAVIKGKWDLTAQLFELMRSEANMRCHSISQTDTNEYYRRHVATQTIPLHLVNFNINHLKQAIAERSKDSSSSCYSAQFKSLILKDVVECSSLPHNRHRVTDQRLMFLCNQVFQRNEYCWHFQNAHCDFYSSLNGWIEETCPYKQYGCSFTQHRLVPHDTHHRIAFDRNSSCVTTKQLNNTSSFCSIDTHGKHNTSADNLFDTTILLDMPVEIMIKILSYLDSYSIKQMMLTCTYLHDFSLSLLKTNGIVQAKWVRGGKLQGLQTWKIKKFTWSFSNAISPIKKWKMNSVPSMAAHLTNCPFVPRNSLDYYMKDKIAICPFHVKGKMEKDNSSAAIKKLNKTNSLSDNFY